MKINIYQNEYEEPNLIRRKELYHCINSNIQNPILNVQLIKSNNRLTFSDFFSIINKITAKDDINVIANLDIIFDETILLCRTMKYDQVYALSRYELLEDGVIEFSNKDNSQDVWIWKGAAQGVYGEFELGKPGSDNRIAHEFSKATYQVTNPSRSIKTYHLHQSNLRNYIQGSIKDTVPGPYLHINPSFL